MLQKYALVGHDVGFESSADADFFSFLLLFLFLAALIINSGVKSLCMKSVMCPFVLDYLQESVLSIIMVT